MTDKTATQNLTRAVATDDPRQMASYLTILRDEVDRRAAAHFYDLRRSQVPPAARLSLNTAVTVASDGNARTVFDTVDLDTDGMADLSAHPTRITFNSAGYYVAGVALTISPGSGPAPSEWKVGVASTGGGSSGSRGVGDPQSTFLGNTAAVIIQVTAPGAQYIEQQRSAFNSAYSTWTFTFGTLWAYKVRDL